MSRSESHVIDTKARIVFETIVSSFSSDSLNIREGGLLFRLLSERDYGVDGELELFENGEVTGKIARIQIKGTNSTIERLKTVECVSCPGVSQSCLKYCSVNNIPFILVYVSKRDELFYYCDLHAVYNEALQRIGDNGKTCSIRIPCNNNSKNLHLLVEIINSFYADNPIPTPVGCVDYESFRTIDSETDLRNLFVHAVVKFRVQEFLRIDIWTGFGSTLLSDADGFKSDIIKILEMAIGISSGKQYISIKEFCTAYYKYIEFISLHCIPTSNGDRLAGSSRYTDIVAVDKKMTKLAKNASKLLQKALS